MHRPIIPGATYFLACVTYERQCFLADPALAQIVVDQWRHYEQAYGFHLHAYCVMPDHYHTVVTVDQAKTVSQILHAVNSYTATLINRHLDHAPKTPVWQDHPWDEVIRNEEMYWQKVAYVLLNPWREGLVGHPLEPYPFSDLSAWLEQKGQEFLQELFGRYKRWHESVPPPAEVAPRRGSLDCCRWELARRQVAGRGDLACSPLDRAATARATRGTCPPRQ